jgi:hypothetical protein
LDSGERRAVGATLASIILFGSLVVSNWAVFESSQQKAQLYSLADAENSLYNEASILKWAAMINALDRFQSSIVTASPLPCATAESALSSLATSSNVTSRDGAISAVLSASLGQDQSVAANDIALMPFDGAVAGDLNLILTANISAQGPGDAFEYSTTDVEPVHIPVHADKVVSMCLDAGRAIAATLSGLGQGICNFTTVSSSLSSLIASLKSAALHSGLVLSIVYHVSQGATDCGAGFYVDVEELAVPGPLGLFTFASEQSYWVSPGASQALRLPSGLTQV